MDWAASFSQHIVAATAAAARALAVSADGGAAFEGVVFHAGSERCYHADDQHVPFKSVPHFLRFAPVPGPDHLVVVRPGETPRLIRMVAGGFWVEPPAEPDHPFADVLETVDVATPEARSEALGGVGGLAYVGDDRELANSLGFLPLAIEPTLLLAALDWERGLKTPYEVACLREAARRAALGHDAVRAGVAEGVSERALHFRYLQATGHLDGETPYPNIIAWDAASAVLHYTRKQASAPDPGHTFLIDAGARHHGYCSDITRTYARYGAHPTFHALLEGMATLQANLVNEVRPGRAFVDLHEASFRGVTNLLCEHGLLTVSPEEAFAATLAWPFFPHGLGHHLGLQVHDVGGRQIDAQGTTQDPPERFPWLRTTRSVEEHHVITIEPGLYMIPLLLEPYREGGAKGEHAGSFDWKLIDELVPSGGIRIEDDVLVTADGRDNLSRPFLA